MLAPVLKSGETLDTTVRQASSLSTATTQRNFIIGTGEKNSQGRFRLGVGMGAARRLLLLVYRALGFK